MPQIITSHTSKAAHGPLVFLTALRCELPSEWLRQHGHEPIGFSRLKNDGPQLVAGRGILFIITGVGPERAREAALWVQDQLKPMMVINVGTTGAFQPTDPLFSWVMPSEIREGSSPDLAPLPHTGAWPLAWPAGEAPARREGALVTVAKPCLSAADLPGGDGVRWVDMEAYAALAVFAAAGIPYFCLKLVSDHVSSSTPGQFKARLGAIREKMVALFSFLVRSDEAHIAVVIPTHNRAPWLARCLDSVIGQTLAPQEIIVVDDGSTDDTGELLSGYGDKIRVVTLDSCHGVSHARNIGVQTSSSPWIAFLDSDDEWTKEKLACQWAHLRQHPFLQISQCEEIWIRDGIRVNRCKHHEKQAGFIFSPSLKMCLVSPSAVIMKRDLFETYGLFDETLPACEDYDLWLRILRDLPVGLNLDPSLVKFGGHEDQLSRRFFAMDRFRLSALTAALARESCYGQRQEIRQIIASKARIMAGGCRKRGKSQEADQYDEIVTEMLREELE